MDLNKKRLVKAFEDHITPLGEAFRAFPWEDKAAYALWLAQSYYLVKHTTNFLCLVASKLGPERPQLHRDVLKHLREEVGHDDLASRDLKHLGYQVSEMPELLETALIWQTQYYWIQQCGPFAHAGYSLMLEGLAVRECPAVVKALESSYGREGATFVRVHAMEDKGHFEEGMNRMLAAPPEEARLALKNLAQSRALYENLLAAVQIQTKSKIKQAA
jgi:hypothetical protein